MNEDSQAFEHVKVKLCGCIWTEYLRKAHYLVGELGAAGEHVQKLAEQDMANYMSEGPQDEDEAHLKKLQVVHLAVSRPRYHLSGESTQLPYVKLKTQILHA